MEFKNLGFVDHPLIAGAIMAQVISNDGKRISIICGDGLYSSSRAGNKAECRSVEDALTFEVFVDGDKDVRGWQTKEDINLLLNNI